MVELISLLVGFAVIPLVVVVGLSYYALYLKGQLTVSESSHYVNVQDVETQRVEYVREAELSNTKASIRNERPDPEE